MIAPPPAARTSSLGLLGALAALAAVVSACGSSSTASGGAPAPGEEIRCPSPIGRIRPESCADVAADFGALSVSGALKHAETSPDAERRVAAIRAADSLAQALKTERVRLCEQYNACKVPSKDLADRDRLLADLMSSLIKLWDGRKLTDAASVERFHQEVLALHRYLDPNAGKAPATGGGPASPPAPSVRVEGHTLAKIEGQGVTVKLDAGVATVTVTDEASHDVLKSSAEQARLEAGKRYLIKVSGSYAPAAAPLLAPGEEVMVRLKYRAAQASELYAALRSIEDPDASESIATWKLAAGEKGTKEATLTAAAGSSGPYLGVGVSGAGEVELDDVELVRGGKVIAAARAEAAAEPHVKTSCAELTQKAIAGKRSLRCGGGAGDKLTLGRPGSHFFVAVRGPSAERAVLRTLSLEGGRSLDATLTEKAEIVLGLAGPGTATVRSIEIAPLENK
jgi:hypothetical protein